MITTRNEALLILAQRILDSRLKPVIDKCQEMPKPIKYNKALDDNSYAEWLAKKEDKVYIL